MAFIEIENPKERDKIVQDYIQTVNRIKERTEDEKAEGMRRKVQFQKVFTPVVQATKESTSKITEEIKNNRAINENETEYWGKDYVKSAIDYYTNLDTKNRDEYYGIEKTKEGYVMGEKNITIDKDSNVHIDDHTYKATPGLWELIMMRNPQNYTSSDLLEYEDIVFNTQVISHPFKKKTNQKPKLTTKYKNILKDFLRNYPAEEEDDDDDDDADVDEENVEDAEKTKEEGGSGIQYLPGNINGLLDRLKLLYAEREAGNITATNNEIVGILDELLRINYLTRTQYNMVCKSLQC